MPSPAEPSRSPQEALLRLEKSSDSPATLLDHAAQVVGIDLALCASHPEINTVAKTRTTSAPKAEWVLRWLLKKLKQAKQFRAQPASFLLLTQLIGLIQPKALATILSDYDFLRVLNDIFADVEEEAVFAGFEDRFAEEPSPSGSESSLTLGSSPSQDGGSDRKGTKRKRPVESGNGDSMEIDDAPQTSASCLLAFIRLLDCLYSLVVLVTETLGDDEVARARLTQAIRSGPEPGAVMLAKSFRIAAVATSHFSQRRMTTDLQHLMYVIPAALGLWGLRASQEGGSENKASNDYFAKYCFPGALRLQHCIALTDLDTDERSQALFGIQRLIAVHVVLPARMCFFERGGSGIDYSADEPDWSAVKPVTDTFRPLLCKNTDNSGDSKAGKLSTHGVGKIAELLPGFFDTAARCVPRDTFRRKTHEAPWLETLFVAVAELAFSFAKEESPPTYFSEFVGVLEQLFRVVLDRDVSLSLHTLLTHAAYTGLFKDELAQVEWNLTALLVKLGVDIFLPNSGFSGSRTLLTALLEKVMLYWRSGAPDSNYEVIKHGIVIPLAHGFTAARDLPSFMELWYEQLVAMEEERTGDSSLSCFSVWEDDDLCTAYGELAQNPFMDAHIATQVRAAADGIKAADGKVSISPSSYAKFVVLEASFRGRKLNFEAADESLRSIVETLSATLSSKQYLHWRWRLWRLARNLLENNLQSADTPLGNTIVHLVEVAAKSIHRRHKDFSKKPCAPLENLEAYRFTLVAMKGAADPSRWDKFNAITEEVVGFIRSVPNDEASISMNSPWNGRVETLNSQSSLALGYFLLLVRSPTIWEQIKVETRRALFEHILALAAAQYDSRLPALDSVFSDARFLQAWASLACHEYLLSAPSVIGDLIHVLAERVKSGAANRKLYVTSLQRIPAPSFSRRQRGMVLELLQDAITDYNNPLEVTVGMASLMAKLAELPKSTAAVTNDWEPIWKMAKAVSLEGTELDRQIIKAFRSLHRAVISKLLVLSPGERNKQFPKLYRKLASMTSHMSADQGSMEHALLRISLTHLWAHREDISNLVEESQLSSCREKVFGSVVDSVKYVKKACKKQESGRRTMIMMALDALDDFQDLATGNEEIGELLKNIEDYVEKWDEFEPTVRRLIRRCVLAGKEPEKEVTQPVMRCAEVFPIQHLYGEEQQLFIRTTMEKFRSMTVDGLVQVMEAITCHGAIRKDCEHYLLVAALVAAAMPPIEDKDSRAASELSSLFTVVAQFLSHCKTVEQFTVATECLDILFRQHPRCVDQFDIDGLLTSISLCLSRYGPHISPKYASTVYIRLCRLVGGVVGLLRQRVGGRHHLILTILTRLLNCLLDRSKKQGRALDKDKNQPYWAAPLQASDAAHFTRLLTSLSDPTLSSVSRPTAHEGLTDQTKKAKRITGQYLQYFVMDYARMCLQGTFSPQIKAAIMPGLYSILDGLSRDAMRSLNADLEVSSRAVFKGLYDDYAKFGKWNKA